MRTNLIIQNIADGNILDRLNMEFDKKYSKIYCIFASMKESGLDIIEPALMKKGKELELIIGIDKKNTTKLLLEKIMGICKEVYLYSNNQKQIISSNLCIFENKKDATVYMFAGNISEGGLLEDYTLCLKQEYNLELKADKEEYEKIKDVYMMYLKLAENLKLSRKTIEELSAAKDIFTTKIYEHTPISINELLGKKKAEKIEGNIEEDEEFNEDEINMHQKVDIEKILSEKFDFEIDTGEDVVSAENIDKLSDNIAVEEIKENISKETINKLSKLEKDDEAESFDEDSNNETILEDINISDEVIDIESMIFTKSKAGITKEEIAQEKKSSQKMTIKKEEEKIVKPKVIKKTEEKVVKKIEDKVVSSKKVDLGKVTNLVMQMSKCNNNIVKIPTYVKTMVPKFFDWPEGYEKNSENSKVKSIKLEIKDIETNQKEERLAVFIQKTGQTYMELAIKDNYEFNIEENDIVRIIKQSSDNYTLEIVSKKLMEYEIWLKFCTYDFKGNKRKYGIM